MKSQKILSLAGLYISHILIGYQGPFSIKDADPHPHTHAKSVVKLLKKEDDIDQFLNLHTLDPQKT